MTGMLRALNRLLRGRITFRAPAGAPSDPEGRPVARAVAGQSAPLPEPVPPPVKRVWIDVGAHFGEKTFAAAQADPNLLVYAFEPNLEIACQRMGLLPNYVVVPMAVAEQDGCAEFHVNSCAAASSLLPMHPLGLRNWSQGDRPLHVERRVSVPTIRLDTFMRLARIDRVDFLKTGAQGADDAVVRSLGDRLRDVAEIALEVQITPFPLYEGAGTRDEICARLRRAGFELTATERRNIGQEENLSFVRIAPVTPADAAEDRRLLDRAAALAWTRPLGRYPGWRFDSDWDSPDPLFRERRAIWEHFHQSRRQVPVEVPWHDGLRVRFYLSNDISRLGFVAGCFEPNEFAFLAGLLKPGMTFVDAGANEGLYTLFAAARVGPGGRVLAFEPSEREFGRLLENVRLNRLDQVEVVKAALSDRGGTAPLRVGEDNHAGHNTLGEFAYQIATARYEDVPLVRLDDAVREHDIARVDVMKIDVEGHEAALLRGAQGVIERDRPVLLIEVNEAALTKQGTSTGAVLEWLTGLGYSIRVFDGASGEVLPAEGRPLSDNVVAVWEK